MRLSLRFIIPLLVVLAAFAYAVMPLVDSLTVRWLVRNLEIRASLIASTVQEPIQDLVRSGDLGRLRQLLTRIAGDERVYAVAFCASGDGVPISAGTLPPAVRCADLDAFAGPSGQVLTSPQGPLLVSVRALHAADVPLRRLVLVHDMSFVSRRSEETRLYVFYLLVGTGDQRLAADGRHRAVELARLGARHAGALAGRGSAATLESTSCG